MPRYYTFGGQPMLFASLWRGRTIPGLNRVAGETRGLSGFDRHAEQIHGMWGPETEYLPHRASGPEPLDPGEKGPGTLDGFLDGLSDNEKRLGLVALVGAAGLFLWKRRKGRAR